MTTVLAVVQSDLDSWGTVLAGYAITGLLVGGWAVRVIMKNRALVRQVREEDLPWR
jgi:hypothetical protein